MPACWSTYVRHAQRCSQEALQLFVVNVENSIILTITGSKKDLYYSHNHNH
jgi:hypothetical protein